jgi:hypothetical protein
MGLAASRSIQLNRRTTGKPENMILWKYCVSTSAAISVQKEKEGERERERERELIGIKQ